MQTCPVCHEEPRTINNDCECRNAACALFGVAIPLDAWAALPCVAPNAEALVDTMVSSACARRYCDDGDTQDAMCARAALLRACVVAEDAETVRAMSEMRAEVAALRVQRDEAVARLAEFADGRAAQKMAQLANDLAGELEESERTRTTDYQEWMACEAVISSHAKMLADMNAESLKIEDHCRTVDKERDEAVADANLQRRLRGVSPLVTKHGSSVIVSERATGAPEAEEPDVPKYCPECDEEMFGTACCGVDYAAPPVAEDAEELVRELESRVIDEVVDAKPAEHRERARAAVLARMTGRPWPTAEALHAAMADTWNSVPLRSFGWGTLNHVRAALSALQGGGK